MDKNKKNNATTNPVNDVEVSFIIPTLNEEKYIKPCLEAIFSQKTNRRFEVIVSDGNSSDNTIKIAKMMGAKTVVSKKRGIAYGRNKGASVARGKYLVFIDADTVIPENYLETMLHEVKRRKLVAASGKLASSSYPVLYVFNFIQKILDTLGKAILIGVNIVVERSTFDKVGGFPHSVNEDTLFTLRIWKAGKTGYIDKTNVKMSDRRIKRMGILGTTVYYLKINIQGFLNALLRSNKSGEGYKEIR